MSVVEFKNAKGELRYQPALPDGRRLFGNSWCKPYVDQKGKLIIDENMAAPWDEPRLYKSKRRASRRASEQIAREYIDARNEFREAK